MVTSVLRDRSSIALYTSEVLAGKEPRNAIDMEAGTLGACSQKLTWLPASHHQKS